MKWIQWLGCTGTTEAFPCIFGFNFLAFDLSLICEVSCTSITVAGGRNRLTECLQVLSICKSWRYNFNRIKTIRSAHRWVCDSSFFLFSQHTILRDFPPIWSQFKLPLSISWIYLYWCLWWIVLLRDVKTPFPPPWLADTAPVLYCTGAIIHADTAVIKANSAWQCSLPTFLHCRSVFTFWA